MSRPAVVDDDTDETIGTCMSLDEAIARALLGLPKNEWNALPEQTRKKALLTLGRSSQ